MTAFQNGRAKHRAFGRSFMDANSKSQMRFSVPSLTPPRDRPHGSARLLLLKCKVVSYARACGTSLEELCLRET